MTLVASSNRGSRRAGSPTRKQIFAAVNTLFFETQPLSWMIFESAYCSENDH